MKLPTDTITMLVVLAIQGDRRQIPKRLILVAMGIGLAELAWWLQ